VFSGSEQTKNPDPCENRLKAQLFESEARAMRLMETIELVQSKLAPFTSNSSLIFNQIREAFNVNARALSQLHINSTKKELKMAIDNLTIQEIKRLRSLLKSGANTSHPYQVGKNYFIRTVTHHLTGKLIQVTSKELILTSASWIADDGRFYDALKTGNFNEVEPFPPQLEVIVGRGALIDAVEWLHALPLEQK